MRSWLWLVLAVMASAISWTYMHRVLLPWEYYVNVQHGPLKEEMGDLYPRWVGTRELLLNGRNPYGKEVSHEIQMAFYGHPIEQTYDKPSDILDEQRFVYPLYVVLLLAPTVHSDFATLQTWAPVVLALFTAISVWIWLQVARWRPPPLAIAALILFILSSPQIAQGLRLRQFSLFVAFLFALASWCVTRSRYFIAGILLALSTIKPQMVALCLLGLLLWSAGDWKKRWPLPAGFGSALAALVGGAELLLPGWPRYFVEGLNAYRKYFPTATSPLWLVLGGWAGPALSVVLVAALLIFAWRHRKVAADSPEFAQILALFLLSSTLVLPLLTPFNHVLLLLPVVILLRDWNALPRLGRSAFTALAAWPWITSLALLAHPPQLESMTRIPLLPSALVLLFPFVVSWLIFVRRPQTA
jgi:hypothetical protein